MNDELILQYCCYTLNVKEMWSSGIWCWVFGWEVLLLQRIVVHWSRRSRCPIWISF